MHLSEELYRAVKERDLPVSDLLQLAIEAELRRQELDEEAQRYVDDLVAEVGEPSATERARAAAVARRIAGSRARSRS